MVAAWRKLVGNALVAARVPGQRRAPFLPRAQLEARRDRRVRAIVAHAAATVPFYREWFARSGMHPRDIDNAADLERLPRLDRETVRAMPERFLSDSPAAHAALRCFTSGTTGIPLQISHDRRSLLANIAYGERERAAVIALCGGSFRPTELYVGYPASTFKQVQDFYGEQTRLPVRPARTSVSLLEPIESIATLINRQRPDVLVGYGAWIDLFFKTIAARGIEIHMPKVVLYMGEVLPASGRDRITQRYGIPVLSRYNAVEAFKIGFSCERQAGFHLHEDLCHVRILRADGSTAAPGEIGAIVISNLVNRATVLLNYPIGDAGAVSPAPCPCGRTFMILANLDGRREDLLLLCNGRHVHPRAIWEIFKDDRDVLQYQLTQHELDRFTLRLATADDVAYTRAAARARPLLAAVLGGDAVIAVERLRETDRAGKFRAVVNDAAR